MTTHRPDRSGPSAPGPSAPGPTAGDPTTLTARCPQDLLALVPVVLGFFPADSVAMLTFGARQTFHARVDLPGPPLRAADLDELVAVLLEPARRHGVPRVAFVVYTPDDVAAARTAQALWRQFEDARIEVTELLRADGARWWPLLAPAPDFPADGAPYDVTSHPFLVQSVLGGRVTHGSRDDLTAGLRQVAERAAVVARLVAEQDDRAAGAARRGSLAAELTEGEWVEGLVRRHVAARSVPDDEAVARLLRALRRPVLRDAAWVVLTRADADDHVAFWTSVLRAAPQELSAPAATLLGWAAWQSGDGALAWCAVEAALAADPRYRLAATLASLLEQAVPPSEWSSDVDWRVGLVGQRS